MITYSSRIDTDYYSDKKLEEILKANIKTPICLYRASTPANLPVVRFHYFDEFMSFVSTASISELFYDFRLFNKLHYHLSENANILHKAEIAAYNQEMEQILSNYPMSSYTVYVVKDSVVYSYNIPTNFSDYIKTPVLTAEEFLNNLNLKR